MRRAIRTSLALALVLAASLPGWAQAEDAPERRVGIPELREQRAQIESNATLGDELRASILGQYDEAISSLEAAASDEVQAREFQRERAGVGGAADRAPAHRAGPPPLRGELRGHGALSAPLPDASTTTQRRG